MTDKKEDFRILTSLKSRRNLQAGKRCTRPTYLFSEDRADWEKAQFWYQDKIHAPEPLPPLDHIFQEAWQISLSQYTTRVFCIPPAQGIAQRMVGCYLYICAIAPPPEEIIGEKAALVRKTGILCV